MLGWQFTDSTSLDDVLQLLQDINRRHQEAGISIQSICVDNCCQMKGKLHSIFGEHNHKTRPCCAEDTVEPTKHYCGLSDWLVGCLSQSGYQLNTLASKYVIYKSNV